MTGASAATDSERMSSAKVPALEELEHRRLHALVHADLGILNDLHAEDYELINPGGNVVSRSEYLAGIESGDLNYHVFEPASPVRTQLSAGMGVVRYQARIEIDWAGGRDGGLFWHTDVYQHLGERWQVIWSQATRIQPGRE